MGDRRFVAAGGAGEFWTEERCFITELHNCDASPEASLAVARVEPGVTTQLHALDGVTDGANPLAHHGRRHRTFSGLSRALRHLERRRRRAAGRILAPADHL